MSELADKHQLHPNQISQWKAQFLSNADCVFEKGKKDIKTKEETEKDKLL